MMAFRDLHAMTLKSLGAIALCGAAFGCAKDDEPMLRTETEDPAGVFVDAADRSIFASEKSWAIDGDRFEVTASNLDKDFVVAENGDENETNAGRFSRFDWTIDDDGAFRLCVIVSDAKAEEDAEKVSDANRQDLEKGCNGKPWLQLSPPRVVGSYADDWGTNHDVTSASWSQSTDGSAPSLFTLLELSNRDGYLLAQNSAGNEFNPQMYSRFDWFEGEEGELYFCQSVFAAETLDAARSAEPANADDLDEGCSGFAWSMLTKD
jgi:hypothetical protein